MVKLGDLAAGEDGAIAIGPFGSSLKAELYTPSGVPVVRGNNLGDRPGFKGEFVYVSEETASRFPRCILQPGDLVFPHRGAIGEVGLVTEGQWLLSTSMMKFRTDSARLDSRFTYYYFKSALGRHELLKNASQVGTPGIGQPLASLRSCEIPLLPLPQQEGIAETLSTLDDKIDLNRRMSATLEALAAAVFKAWFVDFEPVKAKAAGARSFPGMPQGAFDALPATFEDSPIGPVPKGWRPERLGKLIDLEYGKPLKEENRSGGAIKVFGSNGQVGWHDERLVTGPGVVVGRKGNPGVVTWADGDFFPIDTTFYVCPLRGHGSARYWFHMLAHLDLGRLSADSAVPGLNRNLAYMSEVIRASDALVCAFDAVVLPMHLMVSSNEREAATLAGLRDLLLPRLLSGRMGATRIPAAEVAHAD